MTIALARRAAAHTASQSIARHPVNPPEVASSYQLETGGFPSVFEAQNPGFFHPVNICFWDDGLACGASI